MNKVPVSAVGECDTCEGWTRVSDFDFYGNDYSQDAVEANCDTCYNTVLVYTKDLEADTTEWEVA
jgi:hypothetical protein